MPEPHAPADALERPTGLLLAERWADFTKAYAIYPEANVRVRDSLATLVEAARAVVAAREDGKIAIHFHQRKIVAGEEKGDTRIGSNLAWLEERLDRGGLAGVEFSGELTPESALAFSKRLLANFVRRDLDAGLEQLWPETYPGLLLLDRRLEGVFAADHGDIPQEGEEAVPRYHGGSGSGTSGSGAHADGVSRTEALVALVASDPDVLMRLQRIRRKSEEIDAPPEATRKVRLLEHMVDALPAEALEDRGRLLETVRNILSSIETRMDAPDVAGTAAAEEAGMSSRMLRVAKGVFRREDTKLEPLLQPADADVEDVTPTVRAADASIADDLAALHAEIDRLPVTPDPAELLREPVFVAEQLGAYLHYLTQAREPQKLRSLAPGAIELLKAEDPEARRVLVQYLQADECRADAQRGGLMYQPLRRFLREHRLGGSLRGSHLFDVERLVESFPTDFRIFLDALTDDAEDDQALDALAAALGPERIAAAADALTEPDGILLPDRAHKILRAPSAARIPFADIVFARGGELWREEITAFVRGLDLPPSATCALEHARGPLAPPISYLQTLLRWAAGGALDGSFHRETSLLLVRILRAQANTSETAATRAGLVARLGEFRSEEGRRLLEEMLRDRRLPFIPREPAVVRQAARAALTAYGRG